jgi:hypothetical protein
MPESIAEEQEYWGTYDFSSRVGDMIEIDNAPPLL